jgi:hypothetical protein
MIQSHVEATQSPSGSVAPAAGNHLRGYVYKSNCAQAQFVRLRTAVVKYQLVGYEAFWIPMRFKLAPL